MLPVYLSYRPQDRASAERIIRACRKVYGWHSVQHNPRTSCPSGTTIEQHVDDLIAACRMVLIVIGRGWTGIDEYGRYRLSTADVPVRAEVLHAMRSQKEVVVLLVDGAGLPDPATVPDELQELYTLPVIALRPESFDADLQQLFPSPYLLDRLRYRLARIWHRFNDSPRQPEPRPGKRLR